MNRFFNRVLSTILFIAFSGWLFVAPAISADIELGLSDEELLDTIQRHSFNYFAMEHDARTGLVRDRAHNFTRGATKSPASIATTGFALTAYPIGVERDWMDHGTAKEITIRTLQFALNNVEHERGVFYHYINPRTGERVGKSEASPIDTALFLAGAIFATEYFKDPTIRELTNKIYERIEWDWLLNGGETIALAWSPEEGFFKHRWDHYNESMIMYLLAIGSTSHPIPKSSWDAINRPVGSYGPYRLIHMPPLFTHQYSHIWVDFKNKHDKYADYFQNSVNAAKANRQFCIDQSSKFQSYGRNSWGLTASDGPFGYRAYGAPPGWADHDGTIAPTGCGSSIVFTPEESIACLRYFYEQLGDDLWGTYGFSDAFNLDKDWFDQEVIGIDQGALLLMIENYRTGLVWKVMKENIALDFAMSNVGFKEGTKELPWPDPPQYEVAYVPGGILVDGYLRDWPHGPTIVLDSSHRESGTVSGDDDLKAVLRFVWDEQALYFSAKVRDEDVLVRKSGKNIWLDDAIELFIDPEGDGLGWQSSEDFQIGFRADPETGGVRAWSWFQGGEDPQRKGMAIGRSFTDQKGYLIEGLIRWDYLGINPKPYQLIKINPAIHDIDRSDRAHGKISWFMRHEDEYKRFNLGEFLLQPAETPPYEG